MYKKFEMELAGRTLRVDVDRVAKQVTSIPFFRPFLLLF